MGEHVLDCALDSTVPTLQINKSITSTSTQEKEDIMSVQVMGDMPKIIGFEDECTIQV